MIFNDNTQEITAMEAKSFAQWIAFSPFIFQATTVLRDLGILDAISNTDDRGMSIEEITKLTNISTYGIKVLLDFGINIGLVKKIDNLYVLGMTGYFILQDEMTKVNMDFTQDICYLPLKNLKESIQEESAVGLKTFGPWNTLYEGLMLLPEDAKRSWLNFDHYYSDKAFNECLSIVFEEPVRELLDIGGNTGRWAKRCFKHNPDVRVTIMDLPQQLTAATSEIMSAGYSDRFNPYPINILDDITTPFYKDADVIWMSQFLDCFSEQEILSILKRTSAVMNENTKLYIVELFCDRQKFSTAEFSLNATSLYFTCVANGKSRMYPSADILEIIHKAGLTVVKDINDIGIGHTVLVCKLAI